jgi:trehalose 6-phosphate phosphatase
LLHDREVDVLRRLAAAERVFCFLDYDGTLAPLAPAPPEAVPLPGTATLLQELAALPGMRVALVTGRMVADVRQLLDVPGIYYVGIHGLEVRLPNAATEVSEGAAVVRTMLPAIKQQLERALGDRPGILIEDKGLALACHYRLAARSDAAAARRVVATVAQAHQRRGVPIAVIHGHEVAEIRPASASKGKTVCRLLADAGPGTLAVYIGDDQTDEDAFAMLPADAITIRVGAKTVATTARYRVERPADVHAFLRALLACRCGRAPRTDSSGR